MQTDRQKFWSWQRRLEYSMQPSGNQPYSEYTLQITAPGYETVTISGTEILPEQTAIQTVELRPLVQPEEYQNIVIPAHTLYGGVSPQDRGGGDQACEPDGGDRVEQSGDS